MFKDISISESGGPTTLRYEGQAEIMTEQEKQSPDNNVPGQAGGDISPEVLKSALKAFKKRLKLTCLDADSSLGRGPFSSGPKGIYAIQPPRQFPPEVWEQLCRMGRLRNSGHGMYELVPNKS